MNKEKYDHFIAVKKEYERLEEEMLAWVMPIFEKLEHQKHRDPYRRHIGNISEYATVFGPDNISYYTNCCGSDNWEDTIAVDDLLSRTWLRELDEKVNVTNGILAERKKEEKLR